MPLRAALLVLLLAGVASPAPAAAADLWVDATPGCSDALIPAEVTTPDRTWCTVARAATQVLPGDVVRIRPGTYRGTVRIERSGTPAAPVTFLADAPGVVLDGAGATQAVLVKNASDVVVSGVTITGGLTQGVWVEGGARVTFTQAAITANPGSGVRLRGATAFALTSSEVADNGGAGVMELAGSTGARYAGNDVHGNGRSTSAYNGDGIQLGGTGATVSGNRIVANGSSQYEHGIYTGGLSAGWTIEGNVLADNTGANVKAAGGPGLLRRNRLTNGFFGLVLSDNPDVVDVETNLVEGRAQHLVLVTQGTTPGRARLRANTVVQNGRSTTSGEASAVFVIAAASLELRDNLLCYQGADALGVALMVNDPSRVGTLTSDTNWFCARDSRSRHLGWAGSRVDLVAFRGLAHTDARSITSWAPTFDADQRVTSTNWGRDRGEWLGLATDFGGAAMPGPGLVDLGAWQG